MAIKISGTTIISDSRNLDYYGEEYHNNGNTGSSCTINMQNGNFQRAVLNSNCTFTFSNPTSGACSFTLVLYNDGTSGRSITWPSSVKWPNGSTPVRTTSANKADVYTFFTYDGGTSWWGVLSLYNFS